MHILLYSPVSGDKGLVVFTSMEDLLIVSAVQFVNVDECDIMSQQDELSWWMVYSVFAELLGGLLSSRLSCYFSSCILTLLKIISILLLSH